ncbi:MAG: glycerol 3-phosphate dehydrogenase [Candidatus Nephrothrix sp. EaCA]|nr:MAG: glycerol 3-phosphate dehydrogenase [Candidatus Nephrothrix sp. EaCA]
MTSNNIFEKSIGVIGAGNFGTVIANLIAANNFSVLLYARDAKAVKEMDETRARWGIALHERVRPTDDLAKTARSCDVIFPIVPAIHFRAMMQKLSAHLGPHHILIHGTKGLDVRLDGGQELETADYLDRTRVKTMSEVIGEETNVVRVGCLAGPNLSKELAQRQPAATVVSSHFTEVIQIGKRLLRNDRFQVYESSDIIGIELAGVLKNIIAIAAGALHGLGYGDNAKGLLISRGAAEMVYLGKMLGGEIRTFLGVAGIGDLVTTCNSPLSRNFTVGYRLAKGETLAHIIKDSAEIAEGVETVRIAKKCADHYKVRTLITDRLYKVLFENMKVEEALEFLMRFPMSEDIDFI